MKLFTDHPQSVGETYLEHLVFACRFGFSMIQGGLACFVHGVAPFLFQRTGSRTVLALYARMQRDPGRRPGAVPTMGAGEPDYVI